MITEVTQEVQNFFTRMHKGNRDPTTSKKFYGEMAGPKGLRHIFSIFEHIALPGTQQKLGCTTSDTDVPMDAPAAYFKLLLDEDSEFLGEAIALSRTHYECHAAVPLGACHLHLLMTSRAPQELA